MSQPPAVPASSALAAARNQLSADVEIKGTLVFEKDLIAHGRIEGEVLTDGTLTIGKTGTVEGDVKAGSVAIHGSVNGNVTVSQRCELGGEATLLGDLSAPTLVMAEGATFVGRANVTPTPPTDLLGGGGRGRRG